MPKTDAYETKLLSAFEGGSLQSVATKAELAKFKAAASTTDISELCSIGNLFKKACEACSIGHFHDS